MILRAASFLHAQGFFQLFLILVCGHRRCNYGFECNDDEDRKIRMTFLFEVCTDDK